VWGGNNPDPNLLTFHRPVENHPENPSRTLGVHETGKMSPGALVGSNHKGAGKFVWNSTVRKGWCMKAREAGSWGNPRTTVSRLRDVRKERALTFLEVERKKT